MKTVRQSFCSSEIDALGFISRLARRLEHHVARVVEEQVELDLIGAAASKVVVVEPAAVQADLCGIGKPWVYCQIAVCGWRNIRIASRLACDGPFQ